MKIVSIVGARPQFIKLAPLSRGVRESHTEVIIHTGQHFDDNMSKALFIDLNIPQPDYYLDVNTGPHGEQTGRMLEKIEQVLLKEKPDLTVVFGDTNSTLAGALAAVKLHIPVLHIEAGLRSFNRKMPEEINRLATDAISDYLFAPTAKAHATLEREGLGSRSFFTGDIMVDVLQQNIKRARERHGLLQELNLTSSEYYLTTLHRPYNVDEPRTLGKILQSLAFLDKHVLFPVHPRTRKIMEKNNLSVPSNCTLTAPVGYLDFLCLQSNAHKIITDSGGIQKEAYLLERPCITLRTETEWEETVEEGWNLLIPSNSDDLAEHIIGFTPDTPQKNFLGERVTEKMISQIESF